jgi:hypothetical protein
VRTPCGAPGCEATYSDPSGLSKHRRDAHGGGAPQRRRGHGPVGAITPASANLPGPSNPSSWEIRPRPSSQALSPSTSSQSSHGGFHRADVPPECRSIDLTNQTEHQAFNANPEAPTASGYYPNVPVLSNPPEVVNPFPQRHRDRGQANMDGDWGSLTLPARRYYQDRRVPLPPLRYSRPGHVYNPSDHRPTLLSSAYLRPNPGMLFDS